MIDFSFVGEVFFRLIAYLPMTLFLAIASMFFASLLALLLLYIRLQRVPFFSALADLYVLLARALPTMIVLYLVFFALPVLLLFYSEASGRQISINAVPAAFFAVIGLTLHTAAYLTENFRSAVSSVEKGQLEAALACGMTWRQAFFRILLPQAAVFAMPLAANQFLNLLKNTSIAFMITVMELFGAANVLSAENNQYLEVYLVLALMYWSISVLFERLFFLLEQKLSFFKRRVQV